MLGATIGGAANLPRGQVVERVACEKQPDQSYALFLPLSYSPEKLAPVLYLLDARGRALRPIERFRAAAEEFGWILVSSYNSASDTADDPNSPAINAMWNDTHARFAIDERRTYLAGFSGTGRAAIAMAFRSPERIAGVIGCGAGLPDESMSVRSLPFSYFGTVGNRDFNYYEMRELDERLSAAGVPHRLAIFDGGHDWPPAAVAREAVAWMEVRAMLTGARRQDESLVAAVEHRESEPPSASTIEEARRRDERDRATLRAAAITLHRAVSGPDLPLPRKLANDLGVPKLKAAAVSADSPEERLSAERILANLRVQTSFYMPRSFLDRGEYPPAFLLLAVAAEIDPEDPLSYYNLAAAAARAAELSRSIKDLQRAVDRGFRDWGSLEKDPDFAKLRGDPQFQRWLKEQRR